MNMSDTEATRGAAAIGRARVVLSERQAAIIAQREDQQHAEQVLEDRRSGAGHEQAEAWAYDELASGPRR
jgi:hypothetical protein